MDGVQLRTGHIDTTENERSADVALMPVDKQGSTSDFKSIRMQVRTRKGDASALSLRQQRGARGELPIDATPADC
jgi:hypothetical protein